MSGATPADFWERTAPAYDRSMWLLGGPLAQTRALVADTVRGADRVLEIACGTGLFTQDIAPVVGTLVATDQAGAMVERARERVGDLPHVRFARHDLLAPAHDLGTFDAVVAANLLHLLPDLDAGFTALRGALRPGGVLVVPTYLHAAGPVARSTSRLLSLVSFPGARRFDLGGLEAAVRHAGFRPTRVEQVAGLLPIGFVAARG